MARDWKLNDCGDLYFGDGDMAFVDDAEEVLQAVSVRLKRIRGEWAFDFTFGIPWITDMFDVRIPLVLRRSYIFRMIVETPGVLNVPELNFNQDRENRGALITFRGNTIYGPIEGAIQ